MVSTAMHSFVPTTLIHKGLIMKRTNRTREARASYSLQGDSNLETTLNTVNAGIGLTSTSVFSLAHLVTVMVEAILSFLPKSVSTPLHANAVGSGVGATYDSIFSDEPTAAVITVASSWKDKVIGAADDSVDILINQFSYADRSGIRACFDLQAEAEHKASCLAIEALSNDEYNNLIDRLEDDIQGIDVTDKAALKAVKLP